MFRRALPVVLALILTLTCTTTPTAPPGFTPVATAISVSRLEPSSWAPFESWAPSALEVLSSHYGVPRPSLGLDFEEPVLMTMKLPNGVTTGYYLRGWYLNGMIVVAMRDLGGDRTLASLQHTLLHEFIHHLRASMGEEEGNGPHNAEFDRIIRDFGLEELTHAEKWTGDAPSGR